MLVSTLCWLWAYVGLNIKESIFVNDIDNSQKIILINEYLNIRREQLVISKSTWDLKRTHHTAHASKRKGCHNDYRAQMWLENISEEFTCSRNGNFSCSVNITPRRGALRLKPVYQKAKIHCQQHLAALYI